VNVHRLLSVHACIIARGDKNPPFFFEDSTVDLGMSVYNIVDFICEVPSGTTSNVEDPSFKRCAL
jgi:hypothetical protein